MSPLAIFCMVRRRILPERVFGEALNNDGGFERGNWSDVVADHLHDFCGNSFRLLVDTALEDQKAEGDLAFQLVVDSEDGAFGDVGVRRKTSSMPPVERRWPATLIMSSVRDITKT